MTAKVNNHFRHQATKKKGKRSSQGEDGACTRTRGPEHSETQLKFFFSPIGSVPIHSGRNRSLANLTSNYPSIEETASASALLRYLSPQSLKAKKIISLHMPGIGIAVQRRIGA